MLPDCRKVLEQWTPSINKILEDVKKYLHIKNILVLVLISVCHCAQNIDNFNEI